MVILSCCFFMESNALVIEQTNAMNVKGLESKISKQVAFPNNRAFLFPIPSFFCNCC